MVSEIYKCPVCGLSEPVVRFGFTPVGNQRLRCQKCGKTWTPNARSRALSPEKEALIEAALQERLSQRAIARTFKVARTTIRTLAKKSRPGAFEIWRHVVAGHQRRCFGNRRGGRAFSLQEAVSLSVDCGLTLDKAGRGLSSGRPQCQKPQAPVVLPPWRLSPQAGL